MKYLSFCLILFCNIAFAQSYTDFQPNYRTFKNVNWFLDKIEYKDEELILHFRYIFESNNSFISIYSLNDKNAWVLVNKNDPNQVFKPKKITQLSVENEVKLKELPENENFKFHTKGKKENFTCQIHFQRLPENIKQVNLLEGKNNPIGVGTYFHILDIEIKKIDNTTLGNESIMLQRLQMLKDAYSKKIEKRQTHELDNATFSELEDTNKFFFLIMALPIDDQLGLSSDGITKWQEDIVVAFIGEKYGVLENHTKKIIKEINKILAKYPNNIKIRFTKNQQEANLHIFFGYTHIYLQNNPKMNKAMLNKFMAYFWVEKNAKKAIAKASICVDIHRAQDLTWQKYLIRQNLLHCLGFFKKPIIEKPETILNAKGLPITYFTEADKKLIEYLYHPNLLAQMQSQEILNFLKTMK